MKICWSKSIFCFQTFITHKDYVLDMVNLSLVSEEYYYLSGKENKIKLNNLALEAEST